jgi:hypothetical protein
MNKKALGAVAIAGFLVNGCHAQPTRPQSATTDICKQKSCLVTVRVAKCDITVEPEWLGVAKGNRNAEIVWEIRDSPGVTFTKDEPIFFKKEDVEAAARQFSEPKVLGPTKYRWLNTNSAPGTYHYGVRVIDNGKTCPPLDPIIIDEM